MSQQQIVLHTNPVTAAEAEAHVNDIIAKYTAVAQRVTTRLANSATWTLNPGQCGTPIPADQCQAAATRVLQQTTGQPWTGNMFRDTWTHVPKGCSINQHNHIYWNDNPNLVGNPTHHAAICVLPTLTKPL